MTLPSKRQTLQIVYGVYRMLINKLHFSVTISNLTSLLLTGRDKNEITCTSDSSSV